MGITLGGGMICMKKKWICRKRLLRTKLQKATHETHYLSPVAQCSCRFLSEKLFHLEWESNPQSPDQPVTLPSFCRLRHRRQRFACDLHVPAQTLALSRSDPHGCMANLYNLLPVSLKAERRYSVFQKRLKALI
jgi:hypothetical protein